MAAVQRFSQGRTSVGHIVHRRPGGGSFEERAMRNIRLYNDLAPLWILWGDAAEEYAIYCQHIQDIWEKYSPMPVKSVLNIGCGAGKNAFNLKRSFQVTGLDVSPSMLSQARTLNPECLFFELDMRDFSLPQVFDAIFMDDAISHMTTEADLRLAIAMAFRHLAPGGVMVVTPDVFKETFVQNNTETTIIRRDTPDGVLDVVFIENNYDQDPNDTQFENNIIYLIRDHGTLKIERDCFPLGLFSRNTWMDILESTGFTVFQENFTDGKHEYLTFACMKEAGT